jgi:hypothetical protein
MSATLGHEGFDGRLPLPRKIRLDSAIYCVHSVRASEGDADCDHDFEPAPNLAEPSFAVWKCTRCERAFKYEIWGAHRRFS